MSEAEERRGAPTRALSSAEQTVLVIDDVPYLLELASLFLGRTARVVTANGGQAGLDAAWREQPDLILCDDNMPGTNGAELCRTIRRDSDLASTPFIMLVSDAGAAARGDAIRAGADDVLAKPLSRLSLVDTVSRYLAASRVRALPRIETDTPATVTSGESESCGIVRNVSRGGAYVETDAPLVCADEIGLRFRLPESSTELSTSAQVVWCSPSDASPSEPGGAGLRFLEIDGPSVRTLDDFVFERSSTSTDGVLS